MKTFVYMNGRIVPEEKARISPFDRGFNYGDGLFETMKAYDGEAAFLKEHLKRLKDGARFLGMPQKHFRGLEATIKRGVLKKLLRANNLAKGHVSIRITVTRGVDPASPASRQGGRQGGKGGHAPSKGIRPTIVIISKPIDEKALTRMQLSGVKAALIRKWRPTIPGIKSLNYLPNVLGKMEAETRGAYEGIFVDEKGHITEGTSTNVFIVKNGVIKTPPIDNGVLPGVVRKAVIRIAKRVKFQVKECRISVNDLMSCDQAFLTNSIIEVVPLVEVDGKRIGKGRGK